MDRTGAGSAASPTAFGRANTQTQDLLDRAAETDGRQQYRLPRMKKGAA
jgi:hypothetical protein